MQSPAQPRVHASSGYFVSQAQQGILWQLSGHRITLQSDGAPLKMSDLSEADAAGLAQRIVAAYHTAHRDPRATFHGTALHQMKDSGGEEWLVIDSNAQPLDDFNRACAEMSAIWQMRNMSGEENPKLERSFLMGNYTKVQGHENGCPCGHCRREMTAIATPDAMFYSLPSLPPQPMQEDPIPIRALADRDAQPGQEPVIYSAKVADLLPIPTVRLPDASWVGTIAQAEQALQQGRFDNGIAQLIVKSVDGKKLEGPNTPEIINQALVGAIAEVHQRKARKPQHIRAVAVRNEQGEVFIMAMGQDEDDPSKPPVAAAALMKALNERNITEVYVMDYNPAQTQQASDDVAAGKPPMIAALDGGELDRLHKHKPKGGSITVHILPFNDGTLSRAQLESVVNKGDIHDFYPSPYLSPKALSCGTQQTSQTGRA